MGQEVSEPWDLPYPPSVNRYYRHVGRRVLISREGRAYRQLVRQHLIFYGVTELEGELEIQIELHPPDRRRRDVDNTLKALLDALQHGGAYEDDSQIKKITIEMLQPITGGGKVYVKARPRQ